MPTGELKQYMATRPAIRIGYGYRLHRYFQADIAVEGVFGAAGVRVSQQSLIGELRLRDSETLVPFGGRAILPLAKGRLEFHGGGGGAYLHYGEEVEVPSGVSVYTGGMPAVVSVDCPSCKSRGGWGYYGAAGAAVALDSRRLFWLAASTRLMKGTTNGQPLGSVPAFRTNETWLNTSLEFGVRF